MATMRTKAGKKRLELDEEAAMAILEKGPPPNERVERTSEQLAVIEEIMERIQQKAQTVTGPSDAAENLDEYIYSPKH